MKCMPKAPSALHLGLALALALAGASPAKASAALPAVANSAQSRPSTAVPGRPPENDDPYLWLEDVLGERALAWVRHENSETLAALGPGHAPYDATLAMIKELLTAPDRLPVGQLMGGYIYNFWRDANHLKGIWRRTPLQQYGAKEIAWQLILDLDKLDADEKEDWSWDGAQCLPPAYQRCLLHLSRGGKDAHVLREFDVGARTFVADGFTLPEAKSHAAWMDVDTLLFATDWGQGTLTASGYPAEARLWRRGSDWHKAPLVHAVKPTSMSVGVSLLRDPSGSFSIVSEQLDMFHARHYLRSADGGLKALPLPDDADLDGAFRGHLLLRLKASWNAGHTLFAAGSVVSYDPANGATALIHAPDPRTSVTGVYTTSSRVIVEVLDHVNARLFAYTLDADGSSFSGKELALPAPHGAVTITGADSFGEDLVVSFENFLTPTALYLYRPLQGPTLLRQLPPRFDASRMEVEQLEAVSRDGTKIPYFTVHDAHLARDGAAPTLLYAYGGFEVPMTPSYPATLGKAWLAKGGVYVLANIRGGGEFGPAWHEAAQKHERQRAYDDFIAVAEDLIHRGVTSPRRLGIRGGSNGGLLVGAVMIQRPELFHAVVCQVPLLDMVRFTKIGAGASWTAEYGDPAVPEDLAAILRYSPYQNLRPKGVYPMPLFLTATSDDRVSPAHARKMAAKMAGFQQPRYFYESMEGGHASTTSSIEESATKEAFMYAYLYQRLMD